MIFSYSSIFITCIISGFLILFFHHLVHKKKAYRYYRSDILIVLCLIIVIRLLLPVEFPFTVTIYFPFFMNPISEFLATHIFKGIPISFVLFTIWMTVFIIKSIKLIFLVQKTNRLYTLIEQEAKKYHVSDFIQIDKKYNYPVWIAKGVDVPQVLGLKKIILLPDITFDSDELKHILYHEVQHIRFHDNWIKLFVHLLTIIYWWLPFIYTFNKDISAALEIRADSHVLCSSNKQQVLDYAHDLVHLKSKLHWDASTTTLGPLHSMVISESSDILSYRIHYLLENKFRKKTSKPLLYIIFMLPLLSNLIIFEAIYPNTPEAEEGTYSQEDLDERSIIIHHKDGTYTLFIDGVESEIENPDSELFINIKRVEEK